MPRTYSFKCENCGIQVNKSQGKRFCSNKCRGNILKGSKHPNFGIKLTKKRKEQIRQEMLVQYKTGKRIPYQLGKPQYKVRGSKHHNWKGGVTGLDQTLRSRIEFRVWRRQVFEQQENKCVNCGETDITLLVAHHIKYFKDYPELAYDPKNGIILCRRCHPKIHKLK